MNTLDFGLTAEQVHQHFVGSGDSQWWKALLKIVLWRDADGRCYLCGEPVDPEDFHLEHVMPTSRGGTSELSNLRIAHPRCNLSKGNRTPDEWHAAQACRCLTCGRSA